MGRKYNLEPVEWLLNEEFYPDAVSKILDRVMIGYVRLILSDEKGTIVRDEVVEEFNLLVELRDRTGECTEYIEQ